MNLKRSSRKPSRKSKVLLISDDIFRTKRMNDANSDAQAEINAFSNEFKQRFLIEEANVRNIL